jgi:hypothetical protein
MPNRQRNESVSIGSRRQQGRAHQHADEGGDPSAPTPPHGRRSPGGPRQTFLPALALELPTTGRSAVPPHYRNGTIKSATTFTSFSMGLMAGPAVSL